MSNSEQAAPAKKRPGSEKGRQRLKLAATAAGAIAVLLLPSPPGLSPEGQRVLAIVAAAVMLWATEVVPVAVSSLLVVMLLMATGVVKSPSEALAGYSSPIVFFLIGSMVMGTAIMRSGLAERLAYYLVHRSKGSPRMLTAQLLLAMPLMAFVMPSAINRNAMLIPAYEQVFRTLSVGKRDPLARVIMLTLGLLNPFASSAFMTGGLAPMTTSTLLGGFTWFRWFGLMALPYYTLLALGGTMVYLLYRPPTPALNHRDTLQEYRKPLCRDEKVTLAVVAGASVLWLTDFVHHWSPTVPALMAAVVLLSPGVGIFSWGQVEKMLGWSNVFVVGASLSLTQALISTGAASWFAQGLLGMLANGQASPPFLAVFIILVTTVVHLGIPNMSACIALLIPVVAAFANAAGISPVASGLIVGIVVDAVILYPVQTATNLLAYEAGHFEAADVLKVGLGMLALTIAVVVLVAIPWWGLMGLSFTG